MEYPQPYLSTKTSCVAHYTKTDVLSSILKEDGIVLWATKYGFFPDELEYAWPLSIVKPYLEEIANQANAEYDPEHEAFPYILSFTNGIDSKFMWEKYGENGNGVMLVFDKAKLYDYCNSYIERTGKTRYCIDVLYATSDNLNSVLADAYNELQKGFPNTNPLEPFYDCPAFVKNKTQFQMEEEFRLIHCAYETIHYSPETVDNPTVSEELPADLKHRKSNGIDIPYIEVILPKECLIAICIGSNVTRSAANTIDQLLKDKMYNVGIFQSRINIR